jgi:hypothetical protein
MEVHHNDACLGITNFLTCRQTVVNSYKINNGSPAGFLDPYIESLELDARHTFIGTRKSNPATILKAEEFEEEIQRGECQLRWEGETTQCANSYSL